MERYNPKLDKNNHETEVSHLKLSKTKYRIKKASRPYTKIFRNKKILSLVVGIFLFLILCGAYFSGISSAIAPVPPILNIGAKSTVLKCNYMGKNLDVSINVYKNVDNYYKYSARKKSNFKAGNFSKFTIGTSNDPTIRNLVDQIKKVASANNLSGDQTLELAECFVQNIPYDEVKATKILSNSNLSATDVVQYPYETLYKNSGICTDKTYLGSAIARELGYGTALLLFPDAQHMALGIKAPSGYTDFNSNYAYMELTSTGYAPGELPNDIEDQSGKPTIALNRLADLSLEQDPSTIDLNYKEEIGNPNIIIDVNAGRDYSRIIAVKNLEKTIVQEVETLILKKGTLELAYSELQRRDNLQENAYNSYLSIPATKLDCGYHYSFSYLYPYSSSTYSCDTVSNPQKNFAYSSYTSYLVGYNNQINLYNSLISDYNSSLGTVKSDLASYDSFDYN